MAQLIIFLPSKRKEYSLVFQFFESCRRKPVEARRPLPPTPIFCNRLKNLEQLNLATKIPLVQFLAENGFINSLQLRQTKLRNKLEYTTVGFQLVAKPLQ